MSFLDLLKKDAAVDPLQNRLEDSKRTIEDSFDKNARRRNLKSTTAVSAISRTVKSYVADIAKGRVVTGEQHDDLEKFLISQRDKFRAIIARFDADMISKIWGRINRVNRRVLLGSAFGCVLFFLGATGLLFSNQAETIAPVPEYLQAVTYDGQNIGYVSAEEDLADLLAAAKANMPGTDTDILDESHFAFEISELTAEDTVLLTAEDIGELAVVDSEPVSAEGWALKINGETVLFAASKEGADRIIDRVKSSYVSEKNELVEASIEENVEVTQETTDSELVVADEDVAVTYILTGSKEPKVYTVVKGDSAWKIAKNNNLSLDELIQANPEMVPEKIMIGQQINLYEIKPYVTIRTVEIANNNEQIAFSTNYENSADMYKGQQKVLVKGVPGSKEVQTQLTKENGKVVESVVIASAVISEPQPQVTAVGTKSVATFTGTGSLISPLASIEISSAFGSRGNRRHQGVDMRSPTGTPIHAADDGVVTTSKYQGSYGNLIILSHGKGLETYYAHCSSMAVSVGQVVNKGEVIGYVGTTGNATGSHLHFEVRLNGVYQNPLNYF